MGPWHLNHARGELKLDADKSRSLVGFENKPALDLLVVELKLVLCRGQAPPDYASEMFGKVRVSMVEFTLLRCNLTGIRSMSCQSP